ncbi:MAG: glycosyltransferase family 39 protein [Verrucomicrobia bacterium]|nr:glycosyltransferase family 39 protein [Verrucomicrobiota bacterium]
MKACGLWLDSLLPVALAACLCGAAPLGTAFQLGADEGYELMKGLLCSQGHALYRDIWNDQPPLHTCALSGLFRLLGPTAGVARGLSAAFAALLVWSVYHLARGPAGRLAGMTAALLLIAAPQVLPLSASAMLELPAMSVAMAGLLAWRHHAETHRRSWLALSGVLLGCALQIKFTAALVLPALLADGWMTCRLKARFPTSPGPASNRHAADSRAAPQTAPGPGPSPTRAATRALAGFGGRMGVLLASAGGVFGMVAWWSGEDFGVFWQSHFSKATGEMGAEAGFSLGVLGQMPEALAPAAYGIVHILRRRRRELAFAVVFFATLLLVHAVHRPFWPYYVLHFAVALSLLAGVGLAGLWRAIRGWTRLEGRPRPARLAAAVVAWSAMVCLVAIEAPSRFVHAWRAVATAPLAGDHASVRALRQYRDRVRWVLTDDALCAFHAALPVPPPLAVVPHKRVWSGQFPPGLVREVLCRYRPEAVLLSGSWALEEETLAHLRTHYVRRTECVPAALYVLKTIERTPPQPRSSGGL